MDMLKLFVDNGLMNIILVVCLHMYESMMNSCQMWFLHDFSMRVFCLGGVASIVTSWTKAST